MRRALIAHDSRVFRGAIQRFLHEAGFEEAFMAEDHTSLLTLHAERKPELVVIDAKLPPFGAAETIRAVRGFDITDSKIIVVTTETDISVAVPLRRAGANEVIFNGFSSVKLETKLRALGLL